MKVVNSYRNTGVLSISSRAKILDRLEVTVGLLTGKDLPCKDIRESILFQQEVSFFTFICLCEMMEKEENLASFSAQFSLSMAYYHFIKTRKDALACGHARLPSHKVRSDLNRW